MKTTHWFVRTFLIILAISLSSCPLRDVEEVDCTEITAISKYGIDKVFRTMQMIDSYGIKEDFYLLNGNGNVDLDADANNYSLIYRSSVNRYDFEYGFYELYVHKCPEFHTSWNNEICSEFVFGTNKVANVCNYKIEPTVEFLDSISVRDKTYYDVIVWDYSKHKDKISKNTPIITYISGKYGLIKFVRKDNIFSERIFE